MSLFPFQSTATACTPAALTAAASRAHPAKPSIIERPRKSPSAISTGAPGVMSVDNSTEVSGTEHVASDSESHTSTSQNFHADSMAFSLSNLYNSMHLGFEDNGFASCRGNELFGTSHDLTFSPVTKSSLAVTTRSSTWASMGPECSQ